MLAFYVTTDLGIRTLLLWRDLLLLLRMILHLSQGMAKAMKQHSSLYWNKRLMKQM